MASTSTGGGSSEGDEGHVEKSAVHVVAHGENAFKAIGPRPIGKKKKYKFVEPPGVTSWITSFVKKCLVCGLVYGIGYFQVRIALIKLRVIQK